MIKHDKVIVEFAGLDTTTYLFIFYFNPDSLRISISTIIIGYFIDSSHGL